MVLSMTKARERQKARRMLVQALYSWDLSGSDLESIEAQFHADNNMTKVDTNLFHDVLYGVAKNLTEVDGTFEPFLDRESDRLDPVSRAVLRVATYEMLYSIDVPYKVVINEGINLAKTYGPTDAYKYINGILDQVATMQRSFEVTAS